MSWFVYFGWSIFGAVAAGTIGSILLIGKEREPISPEDAVLQMLLGIGVLIWVYIAITKG